MNRLAFIVTLVIYISQSAKGQVKDTLIIKSQISAGGNYNFTSKNTLLGGRYISEQNYQKHFSNGQTINLEVSENLYGTTINNTFDGDIKLYRAWARYSTPQLELRAGLQKINFGSATILRPLMWFDQMDPRDPLQLTDGVWGVLGRYYFLNNANIWIWGLYGNKKLKGWEVLGTHSDHPEFGGRFQLPIGSGEAAITYHHRIANTENIFDFLGLNFEKYAENRLGLDAKVDWVVGLWIEGAWINSQKNIGLFTNQTLLNAGIDYTFGFGNGLLAVYEHLLVSSDAKPFEFVTPFQFSLLSISYPVGLLDNIGAMFYYSWNNNDIYSFLNWQRTYNRFSFHIMAYWNPEAFNLPQQNLGSNLFGGKGIQVMLVFNH
jgi:hypothetical protein